MEKPYTIRVMTYSPEELEEVSITSVAEIREIVGKRPVTWVDVEGEIDPSILSEIGAIFDLHSLALEDVLHTHQRSKVEQYGKTHFLVTRMIAFDEVLTSEQLSIFFGENFVLSIQDQPGGDCLNSVRDRLRKGLGKIREEAPAHLAYALVDAVVDGYFPILEALGERLTELEDQILTRYDNRHPSRIHEIKRDIMTLRRTIWPLRDALNSIVRDAGNVVTPETRLYLRDCYDHAARIIDYVEGYQQLCSDLMSLQQGRESGRMNEILKLLTIISTIFIPPTFIAGIYGMNFNPESSPFNMPELNWYLGYPLALALMSVMVTSLIGWLWFKGWIFKK